MTRWSICLCAVLFVACTDGGPGTESPAGGTGGDSGNGGEGGSGGSAGVANPEGGAGGLGGAVAGVGGAAGVAGQAGAGGAGGMAAGAGGMGGAGGEGGMDMAGDDGGVDDEGYCTVACTGIAPDEDVVEACNAIEAMDECTMHETGGFPASCRWVTQDSEPCLAP